MIPYQDTKYHHPVFNPLYQIERGEKNVSKKEALKIGQIIADRW